VAVAALRIANERGLAIGDEALQAGLATVKWPGRLETLSRDPLLVVDGAHNSDSAQKLAAALREVFHVDKWTLIVGISADKDIPAIFDALQPVAARIIVTRARNTRAADIEELALQVTERGQAPIIATNVAAAMDVALTYRTPIIITGSLFTVADAREEWFRRCGLPVEHD
jgi:dihydrofolate synthase / folylpolyglutamate synthase